MEKKTTSTIMLTLLLISMCSLVLNIQPSKAEPTTITVPSDYPTIQEAINAANPGDTIYVYNGTYYENVIVNKTVSLVGEDKSITLIDGGGNGTVVLVIANNVSISGFTIKNSSFAWPYSGIFLNADNGNISDSIVTNNWYGIWLGNSSHFLSNNNVTNNQYGIKADHSSDNVLLGNRMVSNQYNLLVWGSTLSHYNHSIDNSNLVDNKPVYYWVNQHGAEIPSDAGYVALVNSTEITVKNLTLTNNGVGIQLAYTRNSSITNNNLTNTLYGLDLVRSFDNVLSNNTATNNQYGIALSNSSSNLLSNNNITNNEYGIKLLYSSNNTIYHNVFDNTNQTIVASSTNTWDNGYPSGGNYWSDYTGEDLKSGPNQDQPGSDGIGDTPYIIDLNNTDRYPLMSLTEVHDVAITNITTSKTVVGQGYNLYIDVQVTNKGNSIETFNVTVYVNTTFIATQTVNNLTIGEPSTITFTWNTTGYAKSNYTISAYASPVPYETNTTDNNSTYDGIKVAFPGDINGDGKISISDIVTIASAYGSKRGESIYEPNADIDSNEEIDIYDVVIAASRYGYTEP